MRNIILFLTLLTVSACAEPVLINPEPKLVPPAFELDAAVLAPSWSGHVRVQDAGLAFAANAAASRLRAALSLEVFVEYGPKTRPDEAELRFEYVELKNPDGSPLLLPSGEPAVAAGLTSQSWLGEARIVPEIIVNPYLEGDDAAISAVLAHEFAHALRWVGAEDPAEPFVHMHQETPEAFMSAFWSGTLAKHRPIDDAAATFICSAARCGPITLESQ